MRILNRLIRNLSKTSFPFGIKTSNPDKFSLGVKINNRDLESGNLDYDSVVFPCKVFCPNKRLKIKTLGKLNKDKS